MAADFHTPETKILEIIGLHILNELGIDVKINNAQEKTAPDYILKPGVYLDFQYSNDFKKYGDIRIDTVSAYEKEKKNRISLQKTIRESAINTRHHSLFPFLEQFIRISKKGKYFESNNVIAVIYFIYNYEFSMESQKQPDQILLLATASIRKYIYDNWKALLSAGALKLNDKSKLGDKHGSAFICIALDELTSEFCYTSPRRFASFTSSVDCFIDQKLRYLIS